MREDERLALLLDLREEGKRVLDHQAVAMEQLDAKTQHTLGLAVAALAGAIALLTFTADRLAGRVGAPFVVLFGAAGAVNLAAIGVLLASYVGYRRQTEIAVGPSLDWLARTAEDPRGRARRPRSTSSARTRATRRSTRPPCAAPPRAGASESTCSPPQRSSTRGYVFMRSRGQWWLDAWEPWPEAAAERA